MTDLSEEVCSPSVGAVSGAAVGVAMGEAKVEVGSAGVMVGTDVVEATVGCDVGARVGVGGAGGLVSTTVGSETASPAWLVANDACGVAAGGPGKQAATVSQKMAIRAKAGPTSWDLRATLVILAESLFGAMSVVTTTVRRRIGFVLSFQHESCQLLMTQDDENAAPRRAIAP